MTLNNIELFRLIIISMNIGIFIMKLLEKETEGRWMYSACLFMSILSLIWIVINIS